MKPGPKPLPREVKKRRGTLRPCREPKNPAVGLPPLGRAPTGLSKSERASWRWIRKHAWWLRSVDALVVRQLCEVESEYAESCAAVEDIGRVQELETGASRVTGAFSVQMKLRAERLKLYSLLGLDPSSRGKLEMPERAGDDEVAEFLFGPSRLQLDKRHTPGSGR